MNEIISSHTAYSRSSLLLKFALICLLSLCGLIVFQFFGNAVRGYIDTSSLFYWWGSLWFHPRAESQHGPIILLIAIWLFWRNLKTIPVDKNQPAFYLGLTILLIGLFVHSIGYLSQQTRISIIGLLLFIVGSAYLAGGKRWGSAIIFPSMLMFLAMPLSFLNDTIGFYLRMGVVGVTYEIANFFGFDVIRNGSNLFSADGKFFYDIAPACSGMRSLTALVVLSLVIGYISFQSLWRRCLILALALPFAFVGNVIRIFCIILGGQWFGQEAGIWVHEWFGFVSFIVALGLTLGTVMVLERFSPEKEPNKKDQQENKNALTVPSLLSTKQMIGSGLLVIFASILVIFFTKHADSISVNYHSGLVLSEDQINPVELPSLLGIEWGGKNIEVSPTEKESLPPDTGYSKKLYTRLSHPQKEAVYLSIILSGKDRTSIHKPEICLLGQGWTHTKKTIHTFNIPAMKNGKLQATVLELKREKKNDDGTLIEIKALYAYWFVGSKTVVPTHWQRMINLAIDRLLHARSDRWAYISLLTVIPDGEKAGLARLEEIIQYTLPKFQRTCLTTQPDYQISTIYH
jgi:exosortase